MPETLDTVIIGAGVIGAGVAYALRNSGLEVIILEAESRSAMGISSRNSGVIHAGLYYPADSLKMALCRKGADMLYEFARGHGISCKNTGKYIVANGQQELEHLTWLKSNVPHDMLKYVQTLPPGLKADRALFSHRTGIIDIHGFIDGLINQSKAEVYYQQKVEPPIARDDRIEITVNSDHFLAKRVINCAGLKAAGLAKQKLWLAKGSYFQLTPPKNLDLPALVYPATPKGGASLGVHLTRNVYGEMFLGPDIEWIDDEYYGVDESRGASFLKTAKAYLPWLEMEHLSPAYAGIRPKLSRDHFSDFTFRVELEGRLVHCLGIESPGLTAAMAIGDHVAGLLKI